MKAPGPFTLRAPTQADGAGVAALVRAAGQLEPLTTYAYLLLCSHFAETAAVAERAGELAGVALGYRLPEDATRLFVWQIGVHPAARGQGLAKLLLAELADRPSLRDIVWMEQTIAPSNQASNRLFESFARSRSCELSRARGFVPQDFGSSAHEEEHLVRIQLRTSAP